MGFGLPLIEAAAVGTPCVSSIGGSLPEVADPRRARLSPAQPSLFAAVTANDADDAAAGKRFEPLWGGDGDPTGAGRSDDRVAERVLAHALERCDEGEQLGLGGSGGRSNDVGDGR